MLLSDGVFRLTLPVGRDGWTTVEADGPTTAPVAVSGGWRGEVLHLDLAFLESPHRLDLQLRPDGGLTASWRTEPLTLAGVVPVLAHRAPLPLG